ncbi:MAG: 3'-5' exoribonuclease [Muribaculaceae bacterium]|nr:3'-5' exoribonuclease [Muribaculaceae bacterium]
MKFKFNFGSSLEDLDKIKLVEVSDDSTFDEDEYEDITEEDDEDDEDYDDEDYDDEDYDRDAAKSKKTADKNYNLQAPIKRSLNDDDRDDFVAIDFETMTSVRTSACAIGMVKVIDGEIVQEFYSLINPVRDIYTLKEPHRTIHGISLETAEKASTFAELFDSIRLFIGDLPIICHNKSADAVILSKLMDFYNLSGIDTDNVICTYEMTGKSLSDCCEEFGIKEQGSHHNALWDAEVCARIYLELIGKSLIQQGGNSVFSRNSPFAVSSEIKKEHRCRLSEDQIQDKSSAFINATVVITGVFDKYTLRDDLAMKLQSLGAKITSSISKKTTHVLVGSGAGPKKIEKIRQLQAEGVPIIIIREHEFKKYNL